MADAPLKEVAKRQADLMKGLFSSHASAQSQYWRAPPCETIALRCHGVGFDAARGCIVAVPDVRKKMCNATSCKIASYLAEKQLCSGSA